MMKFGALPNRYFVYMFRPRFAVHSRECLCTAYTESSANSPAPHQWTPFIGSGFVPGYSVDECELQSIEVGFDTMMLSVGNENS